MNSTKKSNTEDFIKKSKIKHNNKYNYDLVKYINNKSKIKIICKFHGEFEQIPNNHLKGAGCPKCHNEIRHLFVNKSNTEKFILDSNNVHNNKYNYSLTDYKDSKIKVKIICKKCGNIFEQTPNNHISKKHGCPNCSKLKKLNTELFIIKCKKIYLDKFDYSLVHYKNNCTKVDIICNSCKTTFSQTPDKHYHGNGGCPNCRINKKSNTELFIKKSILKHGEFYDYNLVEYNTSTSKVKIICKKCQKIFEQTPSVHLMGSGCPFCNESKGEKMINELLLTNKIKFVRFKRFKNCKNKKTLSFDFYLPKDNVCIEFDGIQHFESVEFFGGKESLDKQQENDEIKNNFCKIKNIKLIRINNIDEIEYKLSFLF